MKKQILSWLLLLSILFGLTACGQNEIAQGEASEPVGPIEQAEVPSVDTDAAAKAAQPGEEEGEVVSCTTTEELGTLIGSFVGAAGYSVETTSSTEKSTLYTVMDGATDLALIRAYTVDGKIDHFFVKFSYSWAASENAFAFVLRLVKLCTKAGVAGLTNEGYTAMSEALGLTDAAGMKAYSDYSVDFAADTQWTLTKGVGTLKTLTYSDDLASYELGFYILEKDDDEPNYFAFTVTPAGA